MVIDYLNFQNSMSYIKPGTHGEDFAEQSSKNETFLSKILTVCGQFFVINCSFVAVRKISSMFDSATNEQFLTVCAASEDFPHRLLDDNQISISYDNGCNDVNMQRSSNERITLHVKQKVNRSKL